MIDLHVHTNHSDGSFSPESVVKLADNHKVTVLAITDHDEISGVIPAQKAGYELGITVVPGVELSINYSLPKGGHFHLLGLFIDLENSLLQNNLDWLREARRHRAVEIIQNLINIGLPLSVDDLNQEMALGSIGRPHIAGLLIKKQIVKNTPEAFARFLKKGAPGYVPKQKLSAHQAINIIHDAGGLAIIAHPFTLGFKTYPELGREILKLKELGLNGIEAYYSSHDRYITKWLLDFAAGRQLAVSGGSDFHGKPKPGVLPGIGRGNLSVPAIVYENLLQYLASKLNKTI